MNRALIDFILRMKNTEEVLQYINLADKNSNMSAQRIDEETVLIIYQNKKYILKGQLISYEQYNNYLYRFNLRSPISYEPNYAKPMIRIERLQLILPDEMYLDYQMDTRIKYDPNYSREVLLIREQTNINYTEEQDEIIEF